MRQFSRITLLLLSYLPVVACTPWLQRGQFALVSTDTALTEQYEVVAEQAVTGQGCFTGKQADDLIFSWATEDALSKPEAKGATTLLNPVYTNHVEDKGSCLQVSGIPARLRSEN